MLKFLKHILIILFATILLSFVLDKAIFNFFYKFHKRTKLDVEGLKKEIVFFGSSRCVHHIDPRIIDSICHTKSFNMGWAAANPKDIYAAIKIYLAKNSAPKSIFIQIDQEHDDTTEDGLARQSLLKFYKRGIIDDYFSANLKDELRIPLFASLNYRDFGWREVIKTLFNNNNSANQNLGYTAIQSKGFKPTQLYKFNKDAFRKQNIWTSKAINLCNEKKIKVHLFTAPICTSNQIQTFNRFSRLYNVDYIDYSLRFKDSQQYFSDPTHLNREGAMLFSKIMTRDILGLGHTN
jgi:hypothetical protein